MNIEVSAAEEMSAYDCNFANSDLHSFYACQTHQESNRSEVYNAAHH